MAEMLSLTLKCCGKTFTGSVNLPSDMLTQEERDNMDPLVMSESYLPKLLENCRQLLVTFFEDAKNLEPGATCDTISVKTPIQETNGKESPCVPPDLQSHSSMQRNEDLAIGGGTDELSTNLVKAAAKETLKPESEHTTEADITFDQHAEKTKKKYEAHEEFWNTNKRKIKDDCKTCGEGDALNFALTYYSKEKEIKYGLFHSDQSALIWAYKNVHQMDEFPPFIRIWQLKEITRPLMTTELKVTSIKLTDPLKPKNIILKQEGLPDTFSDSAFIPFIPNIPNKLINSATILEGKLVPTVYGKLTIGGEELETIYQIELDSDGKSCAFGLPQMRAMREGALEKIMKNYITMAKLLKVTTGKLFGKF